MIGQNFAAPAHLRPRPFASGYNAAATGASNLGPASAPLIAAVAQRQGAYTAENGSPGPIDAVTTSGSGLDSHISLQNAAAQAPRAAGWLARITRENVGSDPLRKGVAFEITVTSEQDLQGPRNRITPPHLRMPSDFPGYLAALAAVLVATVICATVESIFPVTSLLLIFMTSVVAVAARFGLGPALRRRPWDFWPVISSSPKRYTRFR